jgi:hypothetical protein
MHWKSVQLWLRTLACNSAVISAKMPQAGARHKLDLDGD